MEIGREEIAGNETCQILINSKTPGEVMENLIKRENVLFPESIQETVQDEH